MVQVKLISSDSFKYKDQKTLKLIIIWRKGHIWALKFCKSKFSFFFSYLYTEPKDIVLIMKCSLMWLKNIQAMSAQIEPNKQFLWEKLN